MNVILLTGRATRDVELRYTPSGTAVATMTLAVDRPFAKEGEQGVDFINVQVWNKSAENCAQYLGKGSKCAVSGRLQIRSYDDKDGNKKYVTEVVADRVEFLDSKKKQEETFGQEVELDDCPF